MSVQNDGAEVKQLKDGDYFGERSLLTAEATNATVKALGRTEVRRPEPGCPEPAAESPERWSAWPSGRPGRAALA
eukprot:3288632-Prymnesium_polylepis.1